MNDARHDTPLHSTTAGFHPGLFFFGFVFFQRARIFFGWQLFPGSWP
jgi:hypothetical protein